MNRVLTVKNLVKNYGKIQAVSGIDFFVSAGEIFALIGPNGAGKSTTLKMVATLLNPTSGEINVGGFDLSSRPEKVREIISYLPEEAGAYKNLTGRQYLELFSELFSKNQKERAGFLEKGILISDLGDRLKDKVKTYSKGMTRKLLLSRAVMSRPKLAILDEPTSGLDVINAFAIRKTIRNLSKEGMSVLLSSHNMLEIEFLADRVAIIAKGKIHDFGTPKELKNKYSASNLEEVFIQSSAGGEK